jgi:single-strand DNA-binding protein
MSNVLVLSGHLGKDPETKTIQTANGELKIVNFTLAHTDINSKKGEDGKYKTIWMDCSMFGKQGEYVAAHAKKGSKVVATGTYSLDEFVGKDGAPRSKPRFTVNNLELLSQPTENTNTASVGSIPDDSVPF